MARSFRNLRGRKSWHASLSGCIYLSRFDHRGESVKFESGENEIHSASGLGTYAPDTQADRIRAMSLEDDARRLIRQQGLEAAREAEAMAAAKSERESHENAVKLANTKLLREFLQNVAKYRTEPYPFYFLTRVPLGSGLFRKETWEAKNDVIFRGWVVKPGGRLETSNGWEQTRGLAVSPDSRLFPFYYVIGVRPHISEPAAAELVKRAYAGTPYDYIEEHLERFDTTWLTDLLVNATAAILRGDHRLEKY